MWKREYSKIYLGVKKEDIWCLWTDVNNWPAWHRDLEYCTLLGEFAVGSHFILKASKAPKVTIEITEVEQGRKFTDCTKFFGAKMYNTHEIEDVSNGVHVKNTLTVTGPLQWLWIKLVAQNVANTVPEELDALVNLAKNQKFAQ